MNKGIILFSKAQPAKGKDILRLLLTENNALNETILIPVLAGLREQDLGFFKELKTLAQSEQNQVAIICSLSAGQPFAENGN